MKQAEQTVAFSETAFPILNAVTAGYLNFSVILMIYDPYLTNTNE